MRLLFILPLLLFSLKGFSQKNIEFEASNFPDNKKEFASAKKSVLRGNLHLKNEDYQLAKTNYLKADSFNPNNALLTFKLGLCYYKLGDDSLAMTSFEKALSLENNVVPDIHYYLGITQHLNGKYAESLENYKIELDSAKSHKDSLYISSIKKLIKEANSALDLFIDSTIELVSLNFNTISNESSVHVSQNDSVMYITSERKNEQGIHSENIYYSLKKSGEWNELVTIGKPLNTLGNDAVVGVNVNGSTLYIYSDDNNGDILISVNADGAWSRPKSLGNSINTNAKETSIGIYQDSILLFVSDRSGNKDIYMSKKDNNVWSLPVRLGSEINTAYDEESPFIINDTLYFASQGHNSIGGYDVFRSYKVNDKWSQPVSLGFPINSPYDDLYYTESNQSKYFVSNRREGKGGADVFMIKPIVNLDSVLTSKDSIVNDSNLISDLAPSTLDSALFVKFEPVYFGFDDFSVNEKSLTTLNELKSFLKENEKFNIIVEAHTDCIGNSDYNKQLSEKRANAIVLYLIKEDKSLLSRLKGVGKGESHLATDCECDVNTSSNIKRCTIEDHKLNRRAEFKVVAKIDEQ